MAVEPEKKGGLAAEKGPAELDACSIRYDVAPGTADQERSTCSDELESHM